MIKRLEFAFYLAVLVLFSLSGGVFGRFWERRFGRYYTSASLCGSLLGFSSNYSAEQVPKIQAISSGFKTLELQCEASGYLVINEASFGGRSAQLCPTPSSFVVDTSDRYCDSVRAYFARLEQNCSLSAEFIRANMSVRYGDLEDPDICHANASHRLSFAGRFCESEKSYLANVARLQKLNVTCLEREFAALFPSCKPPPKSTQTWVETWTTRRIVDSKCAFKKRCLLHIENDFPARFAFNTFYNQLLFISYRCDADRFKFRPFMDKANNMRRKVGFLRVQRPASASIKLVPRSRAAG